MTTNKQGVLIDDCKEAAFRPIKIENGISSGTITNMNQEMQEVGKICKNETSSLKNDGSASSLENPTEERRRMMHYTYSIQLPHIEPLREHPPHATLRRLTSPLPRGSPLSIVVGTGCRSICIVTNETDAADTVNSTSAADSYVPQVDFPLYCTTLTITPSVNFGAKCSTTENNSPISNLSPVAASQNTEFTSSFIVPSVKNNSLFTSPSTPRPSVSTMVDISDSSINNSSAAGPSTSRGVATSRNSTVISQISKEKQLVNAVVRGKCQVVVNLLKEGVKIRLRSKGSNTVLHLATRLSHFKILKLLLKYIGKVDARNSLGQTPLHLAAKFNKSLCCARLLVKAGADVKSKDRDGLTPLFYAKDAGNESMIKFLCKVGADKIENRKHVGHVAKSACVVKNEALKLTSPPPVFSYSPILPPFPPFPPLSSYLYDPLFSPSHKDLKKNE